MKILVLATTFPRWEKDTEPAFVYYLSKYLAQKNIEITVLVPHAYGAKKYEEIDNLKIYRFQYFWPARYQKLCYNGGALPNLKKSILAKIQLPFFLLGQFLAIWNIVRRNKFDIIHSHWIIPQGLFAVIMKILYKIPVLLTAHAGDIFIAKSALLKSISKMIIEKSEMCTVNSIATDKAVKSVYSSANTCIVPMGVDLSLFSKEKREKKLRLDLGVEEDGVLILSVGRFAEKKGLIYLIEAVKYVIEKHKKVKLAIIGFGPEEENLKRLVQDLTLNEYIEFLGKVPNSELPKYYASADIFVLPSIVDSRGDTEGLGVVLLEALASGCAVIGSEVGGITDIIRHRQTGLLTEQKNPNDLAKNINELIENTKLREELANGGHKHTIEMFSWDSVSEKFEEILYRIKQGLIP